MTNESFLLTPEKTSQILCVNEQTLAVWRCSRRYSLPWVKIGRKVMYRESDVYAFIESRMEGC